MQVVSSARTPRAVPMRAIVYAGLASVGFVGGGLLIGWFAFGFGFVGEFMTPRPTSVQMATGALAWGFALVTPAVFLIVGLARLVDAIDLVALRRRPPRPVAAIARALPPDHVAAARVRLPDGRVVPELVVGPFGIAVIEELPPPERSRDRGGSWEVKASGRWVPIENPLERASRDAERVRMWLAHDDRDHVTRVHAAVVDTSGTMSRTPACAVIAPDEILPWLASLPVQRTLTPARIADIVETIRGALV